MSHPMSNEAGGVQGGGLSRVTSENDAGPDPVIGAGIALLGIFLMGVGGAAGAHYLFNFATLVAVLGAVLFVLFVALTALKQRRALGAAGRAPTPDSGAEQRDARD